MMLKHNWNSEFRIYVIPPDPSTGIHRGEPISSEIPAQDNFWHQQFFKNRLAHPQLPPRDPQHCQQPGEDGRGHGAPRQLAKAWADWPLWEDDHEEEDELSVHAAVVGWSCVSSTHEDSPGQHRWMETVQLKLKNMFLFLRQDKYRKYINYISSSKINTSKHLHGNYIIGHQYQCGRTREFFLLVKMWRLHPPQCNLTPDTFFRDAIGLPKISLNGLLCTSLFQNNIDNIEWIKRYPYFLCKNKMFEPCLKTYKVRKYNFHRKRGITFTPTLKS